MTELQDLDTLYRWSCDWQMLHRSASVSTLVTQTTVVFFIGVVTTEYEKDLGVIIDKSLSHNRECAKAVSPANNGNNVLGIIHRT